MAIKSFKQLREKLQQDDSYWVERSKLNFSIELNRLFKQRKISQQELATRINTSSPYITKVFRGDVNFTIETMAKLALAVDGELQIHIAPRQSRTRWFDIIDSKQPSRHEISNEWVKSKRNPDEKLSSAA
ncbi:MAG: helix-turn-helix domain-containing protein [Methylobacter sp.]